MRDFVMAYEDGRLQTNVQPWAMLKNEIFLTDNPLLSTFCRAGIRYDFSSQPGSLVLHDQEGTASRWHIRVTVGDLVFCLQRDKALEVGRQSSNSSAMASPCPESVCFVWFDDELTRSTKQNASDSGNSQPSFTCSPAYLNKFNDCQENRLNASERQDL